MRTLGEAKVGHPQQCLIKLSLLEQTPCFFKRTFFKSRWSRVYPPRVDKTEMDDSVLKLSAILRNYRVRVFSKKTKDSVPSACSDVEGLCGDDPLSVAEPLLFFCCWPSNKKIFNALKIKWTLLLSKKNRYFETVLIKSEGNKNCNLFFLLFLFKDQFVT